jgi:hypothetical protein
VKILAPLALALALASCNSLSDRVDWVDYGDDPMQNPQYMADMTAAGATGPEHEALASRAGSWSVEGRVWMGPGAEPMPMNATATTEVLLGGRCIVEEFKSEFMGTPFEGRLMQGYDNLAQRYWSVWSDDMSTGCWITYGTETAPGQLEFRGTAHDVLTPSGRPTRMTTTVNGDGSYTMKMFDTIKDGGEFQSMELRYTRS